MTHQEFEDFILKFDDVWLDYPFGDDAAVYRYGKPEGRIVAIVKVGSNPLKVSLKCDPQLAKVLRDKYETVLPGQNLSKKHWNTILCTGQLPNDEIFDLARLSYTLASEG